jgi:hypothetical protein
MDRLATRCIGLGRDLATGAVGAAIHLSDWVAWHVGGRVLDSDPAHRRVH